MTLTNTTVLSMSVLELLRTSHGKSTDTLAIMLNLTENEYQNLEDGEAPLTPEQADILGTLYKVRPKDLSRMSEVLNYNIGLQSRTIMYVTNYYEGNRGVP